MTILAACLLVFWSMQVFANVAFKYGSLPTAGRVKRWLTGFVGGNVVGASSIYFLMRIYEQIPNDCNLAAVLANSGGFVGSQLLLAWLFRSRLCARQWAGIALVTIGTIIATLGRPGAMGTAHGG